MTIYFDYTAGRGNFDEWYENNDYERENPKNKKKQKISNQKTNPVEWKPTFIPKIKSTFNSNIQNQNQTKIPKSESSNVINFQPKMIQSKPVKQVNNYNKKCNRFRYTVEDEKQTDSNNDNMHSSVSLPSEMSKFNLFTQEMVDFAPSSRVFFNPTRINGECSLIVALKHEKYLKKKSFNKSFNSFSSQSLLSTKMITSSSVFELHPCNDASIKSL